MQCTMRITRLMLKKCMHALARMLTHMLTLRHAKIPVIVPRHAGEPHLHSKGLQCSQTHGDA